MLRIVSLTLILLLISTQELRAESNCTIAAEALKYASSIRGLRIKKGVPCKLQSKAEVEKYLRDTLKQKITPEQLSREENIYKFLGLIPHDYNYVEGIVNLYREQIGGYYDSTADFYVMANWMPDLMQLPIAVHELTHALQDQHFDLSRVVEDKNLTTDQQLAHSALVEGDATAVMLDYSGRATGAPPLAKQASVSGFMVQNIIGATLTTSLQSAPAALQALMIFPYISGLNYVHHLIKTGGYSAVDGTFKRLPRSTREILHNEIDFNPVKLAAPTLSTGPFLNAVLQNQTDTLGEFVLSTILGSYLSPVEASVAARGWVGDRVDLLNDSAGSKALYLQTVWENEVESREFFTALVNASRKRFGIRSMSTTGTDLELETTYKLFKITQEQERVTLAIIEQ